MAFKSDAQRRAVMAILSGVGLGSLYTGAAAVGVAPIGIPAVKLHREKKKRKRSGKKVPTAREERLRTALIGGLAGSIVGAGPIGGTIGAAAGHHITKRKQKRLGTYS